jgi:phage terminase small subunit
MAILATVTTQSSRPLSKESHELYAQSEARGATCTQAAIDAGFSSKSARAIGGRLHRDPRIAARVVAIKAEIVAELDRMATPVATQARSFIRQQVQERQYRLSIVQDVVDRLRSLMDSRAAAFMESGEVCPGGETGLLARSEKMIGSGKAAVLITEYKLDSAVLSELRESLKQAAIESGDWDEKQIKASAPADDATRGLSVEQLYARQAILLEAKAKIEALESGKSVEAHRVIEARPEMSSAPVTGSIESDTVTTINVNDDLAARPEDAG